MTKRNQATPASPAAASSAANPLIPYVGAMLIFGTIGLFVKRIDLPTVLIVLARGGIGAFFLLIAAIFYGNGLNLTAIRANLGRLVVSGIFLGLNWVFLFEAYKHATIADATLLYYLAPILIMAASTVFLKEKLTLRKCGCAAAALLGMSFIAGIWSPTAATGTTAAGVAAGIAAAFFYAGLVVNNKYIGRSTPIDAMNSAFVQLFAAFVVLLPYALASVDFSTLTFGMVPVFLLVIMGIVHTGVAYKLYFSAIPNLEPARIAVFAYVDPLVAILLSILLLGEPFSAHSMIGAVLILGASTALEFKRKPKSA